jgi:hypothetical protein
VKARALGLSVLVLLATVVGAASPGQAAHTMSSGTPLTPGSSGTPLTPGSGYWMLTGDGHVFPFGGAARLGESVSTTVARVDLEPTPNGHGYWILGTDGSLAPFGDAVVVGSGTDTVLAAGEAFTSVSVTPDGGGYWLFTTAGRVLSFGTAAHFGDLLGVRLNGPVLDSVATPSGRGYFMVASDGGVFTFGDAVFAGSMGATPLNQPVVSMAPDPDLAGYWLVAGDGGIFSFDAPFHGSLGGTRLNRAVTRMVGGPGGYLMVATDGGIFSFGTTAFHGSLGADPPPSPVVAVGVVDPPEPDEPDEPVTPETPAAPETIINSGPEGPTSTTSPSFSFTASQDGPTFECSLDGASYAPCTAPRNYADLVEGSHTFAVRATAGGVTDPTPANRSFTVDTQGPVVEILSPSDSATTGSTGTILFSVSDQSPVTVHCRIEGDAVPCDPGAGAFPYGPLPSGFYSASVTAQDALGNTTEQQIEFQVDATGPAVEILSPQQNGHVGPTGTIEFQAPDAVSFDCAMDGIGVACGPGSYSYSLDPGPHTFVVAAFDELGNAGIAGVDFVVDVT